MAADRTGTGLGVVEDVGRGAQQFVFGLFVAAVGGVFGHFAVVAAAVAAVVAVVDLVAIAVDGALLHRAAHLTGVAHALRAGVERPRLAVLVGDAAVGTGERPRRRQRRRRNEQRWRRRRRHDGRGQRRDGVGGARRRLRPALGAAGVGGVGILGPDRARLDRRADATPADAGRILARAVGARVGSERRTAGVDLFAEQTATFQLVDIPIACADET